MPPSPRRPRWVLAGLMLGLFVAALDQTVFATALPALTRELGQVDALLWVPTAYVVTATVTMPVYGLLGDLVGRGRMLVAALTLFLLGSVIGGLAPDLGWLVAGRAVQGLGGGGLLVLVQAMAVELVPPRDRPRQLSIVGAVFALAAVTGPLLGGWLADTIGWRWAFWLNLPVGAVALAAAGVLLRRPAPQPVRIDVAGIAAMAVAVSGLVLLAAWGGTTYAWTSPVVVGLAAVAVLAGAVLLVVERRAPAPLIPPALVTTRGFCVPTLAGLVMAVALFGTVSYLPTHLQLAYGLSARGAGLLMLALVGGLGLATLGSAEVVRRTARPLEAAAAGGLTAAAGLALTALLPGSSSLALVGTSLFVLGLGIGGTWQVLLLAAQAAAPPAQLGTATGLHTFVREIGVVLGTAVVGAAYAARLPPLVAARLPADAYRDALAPVLLALAPTLVLAAVGLMLAGVRGGSPAPRPAAAVERAGLGTR
ncbi:MAG: MFS transporter [Actinomycetes bacterium]